MSAIWWAINFRFVNLDSSDKIIIFWPYDRLTLTGMAMNNIRLKYMDYFESVGQDAVSSDTCIALHTAHWLPVLVFYVVHDSVLVFYTRCTRLLAVHCIYLHYTAVACNRRVWYPSQSKGFTALPSVRATNGATTPASRNTNFSCSVYGVSWHILSTAAAAAADGDEL